MTQLHMFDPKPKKTRTRAEEKEDAKHYALTHPDATPAEIAEETGTPLTMVFAGLREIKS